MSARFNTLHYALELEKAGLSRDLAQRHATLLHDDVLESVTTKKDLKELELSTRHDLKELELATRHDLKELEHSLTIRFGGMLAVAVGILVAVQKLL